jgi:chromosome segregation ATPase
MAVKEVSVKPIADIEAELQELTERVRGYQGRREKLSGDVRAAEVQAQNARAELIRLGVEDAKDLSVEALKELAVSIQAELKDATEALRKQLDTADPLLAEYEGVVG